MGAQLMQQINNKKSKIKVLHMSTIDFTIDKMLLDKISYLKSYGYDISFASSKGKYFNNITGAGFKFYPIEMSREINFIKDMASIFRAYKYLKKEKFTIVHTHTAKAGFIGRIAAKLAGVPVIMHTSHGLPFYGGQGKLKYNIYLLLEKFASSLSDYVFSQNLEDVENMKQYKFKPKYGIGYEGNGVDTRKLDTEAKQFDNLKKRKELGISDDSIVIGYYARLEPVKGHMIFIDALKQVVANYPNIICLMAGKGYLEEEIKSYIKAKNLEKNIKFLGFREDIHEIINITDIVVLASEKEGIPRVLMESMYFKKPVVATNVLGTKELVIHGETGLFVEYKDVKGLEEAIIRLLEDERLRLKMGQAGHERIKSEFTEEMVAKRIHDVYKDMLDKKGIAK